MKKLSLTLLLLFAANALFAQKDSLAVVSHWKKMEMHDYKVTKVTSRLDDSLGMLSDSVSYTFRLIVLDSTANGYRLKWQFDDSPLVDEVSEDEYDGLTSQFGDLDLIYTTDKTGRFKEIENWQDISKYYTLFYDMRIDEQGNDTTATSQKYIGMKKNIATKEGVENFLFDEMRLFHLPYGYKRAIGDTLRSVIAKQIEPTSERSIGRVKSCFSITSRQAHEAFLYFENKIDTADANIKLRGVVTKYLASLPENTTEQKKEKTDAMAYLQKLKYENTDLVTYDFNYRTGFFSKIHHTHTLDFNIGIDKEKTVKETIIEGL